MCHISPTAQVLGLLVTMMGGTYIIYHIWCFDRGRCLVPKRRDIFRWFILLMLLCSLVCFLTWSGSMVWIKYEEYYTVIPHADGSRQIVPVPWQLWSVKRQNLIRATYHVASIGWALLVSVHAEETLYWAYLIGCIRRRNSPSWFSSIYFKIWVMAVIAALAVVPTVTAMDTSDLNEMEHHLFFAGAILAVVLFVGSIWLLMVFPGFIQESRRQGVNPEVLGRLQYFKELNTTRTVFRFMYAGCLLTLAVDAFTKHKHVNASPFWTDVMFIVAYFSAITSSAISVMILLPRSMTTEAGAVAIRAPVFVKQHHQKRQRSSPSIQTPSGRSTAATPNPSEVDVESMQNYRHTLAPSLPSLQGTSGWEKLGERLNIEKEHIAELEESVSLGDLSDAPFAPGLGARRLDNQDAAFVQAKSNIPRAIDQFTSPLDVGRDDTPVDLNIVVVTDTVVRRH